MAPTPTFPEAEEAIAASKRLNEAAQAAADRYAAAPTAENRAVLNRACFESLIGVADMTLTALGSIGKAARDNAAKAGKA
ncbi:MAG: hypothetical protein O9296_01865 [Novosphingobium sp.]|nr:hypothetical protein [Novosphingobium sp.]